MAKCDKGVENLMIDQVNMRGLLVEIDEELELEDFEDQHLKNTQMLRHVHKVRELVPDVDESEQDNNEQSGFTYRFYITLGVRSLSDEDAKKEVDDESITPMLEIQADYVVQYLSKCQLNNDDCFAFADQHVYFHAWSYFRELVQSSCGRLGITCIPIPPYKITKGA